MGANSNLLKKSDEICKKLDKCRFCGKQELINYINLGKFPLPNNLFETKEEAINCDKFPLGVNYCNNCSLSQLTDVVDTRLLFKNYFYRSGISNSYKAHSRELAKECKKRFKLVPHNQLVVDVGGNDGSLLKEFTNEIPGVRVLNIDPASNLCKISREQGVPAIDEFFNIETALQVLISHGKANLITCTNCFAHVSSQRDFLLGIKVLLHYHGALVIEFPYLVDTIKENSFGQLYAEHVLYLTLLPIIKLCAETGLRVFDVKKFSIHDGTLRVYVTHEDSNLKVEPSVEQFIKQEVSEGYNQLPVYKKWEEEIKHSVWHLKYTINELLSQGKKIAAIGASAKGNTLLNTCEFTQDQIGYICDDTPEKIGLFSPGAGIPIVSVEELKTNPPDYVLILAWNFTEELIQRLKGIYEGPFIVPLPKVKII